MWVRTEWQRTSRTRYTSSLYHNVRGTALPLRPLPQGLRSDRTVQRRFIRRDEDLERGHEDQETPRRPGSRCADWRRHSGGRAIRAAYARTYTQPTRGLIANGAEFFTSRRSQSPTGPSCINDLAQADAPPLVAPSLIGTKGSVQLPKGAVIWLRTRGLSLPSQPAADSRPNRKGRRLTRTA